MRTKTLLCAMMCASFYLQPAVGTGYGRGVDIGPLTFDAQSKVIVGRRVRTVVRVVNRGRDSTRIELAADCPVALRLYDIRDPATAPVWDGAKRLCFDMSRTIWLKHNKPAEFERVDSIARILGDSLKAGRYSLSAIVRFSQSRLEIAIGAAVLQR